MLLLILYLLISSIVLLICTFLVPGLDIQNPLNFALSALVIGFLNFIMAPVFLIMDMRVRARTWGLISFVLNFIFLNVSFGLIDTFSAKSWIAGLIGALILAYAQVVFDRTDEDRAILMTYKS